MLVRFISAEPWREPLHSAIFTQTQKHTFSLPPPHFSDSYRPLHCYSHLQLHPDIYPCSCINPPTHPLTHPHIHFACWQIQRLIPAFSCIYTTQWLRSKFHTSWPSNMPGLHLYSSPLSPQPPIPPPLLTTLHLPRQEFEAERKPDLRRDVYLQDIHCVSSLCKAYFRELPDPLLTYRLYDKFAVSWEAAGWNRRLRVAALVLTSQVRPMPDRVLGILNDRDHRKMKRPLPFKSPSPAIFFIVFPFPKVCKLQTVQGKTWGE